MRIIIQAFSDDEDVKGVEFSGDSVAEVETFDQARSAIDDLEKNGI